MSVAVKRRRKALKAESGKHIAEPIPDKQRRQFEVKCGPDETEQAALARVCLHPTMQNGITIADYTAVSFNTVSLNGLVGELQKQVSAVNAGDLKTQEALLATQSSTLDVIFNELARRALHNLNGDCFDAGERLLKLALRAQSQSRATIETLSVVKNPQAIAFFRQANIANGPQQVNNGIGDARTGNEITQPKLLEQMHGQSLDIGSAQTPSAADSQVETVGIVNRPKDSGR